MYGPVDTASAQERRICGVDDGINAQGRYVGDDDFKPHIADLPREQVRRQAAVVAGTRLNPRIATKVFCAIAAPPDATSTFTMVGGAFGAAASAFITAVYAGLGLKLASNMVAAP